MATEVKNCLQKFYLYLNSVYPKWRNIYKTVKDHMEALRNLTEELNFADSDDIDPNRKNIERFPEARDTWIFRIKEDIYKHIEKIRKIIQDLHNDSQELKQKYDKLEKSIDNVSFESKEMEEIINGNPHTPTFDALMLGAKYACKFLSDMHKRLKEKIEELNIYKEKTIEDLEGEFQRQHKLKDSEMEDVMLLGTYTKPIKKN
ncbi:uncharacterized protein LOC106651293 [Trichogramma pretiosum]|uniref:uncharacterized protein LOC106651293 n=1 Tax=Trichogramma pretiosum TaxID=7493 RepID=UPI0006C9A619|nr:uncharacterized protein LOC106651293 [Trichogramma pretiosum]